LSFSQAANYAVGFNPIGLTAADFNGDGKLDLATSLFGYFNFGVVNPGNGDGTLQDPAGLGDNIYNTDNGGITHGDFNGDGNIDLAETLSGSQVAILLGHGDGTFATPDLFSSPGREGSVTVGDFNEDGKVDLVTTNGGGDSVTVMFGDGEGGFHQFLSLATDYSPNRVAVADVFGDGHQSIITSHPYSNTVDILRGNGDGTFQAPIILSTGDTPSGVAVGDLNGDGRADLVVANNRDNNLQVFLNQGGGTFADSVAYPTDNGPNDVVVGDFNRDGFLDLATCTQGGASVNIFSGRGDGTVALSFRDHVGDNPNGLTVGDFNGDGWPDIATANFGSNNDSLLLNEGGLPARFDVTAAGRTVAGAAVSITVTAREQNGSVKADYTGVVHFTSTDSQAALPADYLFTDADQGQHTFTVRLRTAGEQSVAVATVIHPTVTGVSPGVVVSPTAVASLGLSGFPDSVVAGAAANLHVEALDAYGNVVPTYRGTVRFRATDSRARLPRNCTFTAPDQGSHGFPIVLVTAGVRALAVSDVSRPAHVLVLLANGCCWRTARHSRAPCSSSRSWCRTPTATSCRPSSGRCDSAPTTSAP
jgi:hypothetical protein